MGVRGFTTFINMNKAKYMKRYKLHDSTIVIDGNNIACQLYKWHCKRNDCFGGDYDKYAKVVFEFFTLLHACNVTPIVVFDGGYENKKMKTVYNRLRKKIKSIKYINSTSQSNVMVFPVLMNDLFIQIVHKLNCQIVRTDFEADYEMACLAQNLKCPLLSYDSDFYIFDVMYIPFSSFYMEKYKLNKTQFYIKCEVFTSDSFIAAYPGLSKTTLPLLATLLGNDYIKKSNFKSFFDEMKIPKGKHLKSSQQKTIAILLKWLQNETFSSAVTKIVNRMKKKHTERVLRQIKFITQGYICRKSILLSFLGIELDEDVAEVVNLEIEGIEKEKDSDEEYSEKEESASDVEVIESEEEEPESDNDVVSEVKNEENESDEDKLPEEALVENQVESSTKLTIDDLPSWFLQNFRKCKYPSNFMDILTRNKYFCNPQVEDYSTVTSYDISVDILSAINKILTSGFLESLTYVSRNERRGMQNFTTPPCNLILPKLSEIEHLNREQLKDILLSVLEIDRKKIWFLDELPESWHLYILGIIYWIQKSEPKVTNAQLYSIFLCMLVLSIVDPQVGFIRSTAKLSKKLEPQLKSLSTSKNGNVILPEGACFKSLLKDVTYNQCVMCIKELVTFFQMEYKMAIRASLYNVKNLHSFAELQTCLLHIQYLNMLLNEPFSKFLISAFYDGTFMYNMTANLNKRIDVESYLNNLLGQSSSILLCCKFLVNTFLNLSQGNIKNTKGKGRRRKKNNKKNLPSVIFGEEEELKMSENDDEIIADVNNKFYLLCMLK